MLLLESDTKFRPCTKPRYLRRTCRACESRQASLRQARRLNTGAVPKYLDPQLKPSQIDRIEKERQEAFTQGLAKQSDGLRRSRRSSIEPERDEQEH